MQTYTWASYQSLMGNKKNATDSIDSKKAEHGLSLAKKEFKKIPEVEYIDDDGRSVTVHLHKFVKDGKMVPSTTGVDEPWGHKRSEVKKVKL